MRAVELASSCAGEQSLLIWNRFFCPLGISCKCKDALMVPGRKNAFRQALCSGIEGALEDTIRNVIVPAAQVSC